MSVIVVFSPVAGAELEAGEAEASDVDDEVSAEDDPSADGDPVQPVNALESSATAKNRLTNFFIFLFLSL